MSDELNASYAKPQTATPVTKLLPRTKDVIEADARVCSWILRTPILVSDELDGIAEARVFLKAEPLQLTGSFKIRGAVNRLLLLSREQRKAGVVAVSSGNHAHAIAYAARRQGIKACVLVPNDIPRTKLSHIVRNGAEVIFYNRLEDDRLALGRTIASGRGAALVPSSDDPDVIAGQGTLGLEFSRQVNELGFSLDILCLSCCGGGLVAGCALANAQPSIYAVEPVGFDDMRRSLISGRREKNLSNCHSICDSLLIDQPGELTFELIKSAGVRGIAVTDDEVRAAMRFAFLNFRLVVEPGGAAALAAVLARKLDAKGKVIGIVCSGGNVDYDLYQECLMKRPQ